MSDMLYSGTSVSYYMKPTQNPTLLTFGIQHTLPLKGFPSEVDEYQDITHKSCQSWSGNWASINYNAEFQMKSGSVTFKLTRLLSLNRTWQIFHSCTLEFVKLYIERTLHLCIGKGSENPEVQTTS